MSAHKATAIAHPNIALVKYWGKRDEKLVLPHQSSLSVTIAPLQVKTTVQFGADREEVTLNHCPARDEEKERILFGVALARSAARQSLGPVRVESIGNFPPAAGLASSAAAFAALSVAARAAAGLPWDVRECSILARQGSGSACRSIRGGVCVWRRGRRRDGADSFAEQIFPERHWPSVRLLAVVLAAEEKEVSSREGMRRCVETSPFYSAWAADAEAEVTLATARIAAKDLAGLGQIAERNAWRMHAVALSADPGLCYFAPATVALIRQLGRERKRGLPAWFTLDAGPNPFLLTDAEHEADT
ncbi:MAG TPA: diphosphomevalonate decarboxylase, partial [Myxococcaceae bacterium]|nr:diphosphomevalonate decarboxylase [Myxococcaceae bacterium]